MQTVVLLLEFIVQPAQVAAAVRRQVAAWVFALFAVAEQGAVEPGDAFVPRQLHHGFGFRDAHQLGRFRAVAEIFAGAVGEQVHGGAVDELEALLSDSFPVIGRDAFAHNFAGDGNELQVEILDPELINHFANFFDLFRTALLFDKFFNIHCHGTLAPLQIGFFIGL